MLKVAIVGCGKIADSHAMQIQRIEGCEIVGVCDREPLMAKQLYERFPVKRYFTDLQEMLEKARPDVVHITTPAESHFNVAEFCLEHGLSRLRRESLSPCMQRKPATRGVGRKKRRQTNGRPQRSIQPCCQTNAGAGSIRLPGRPRRAHRELLLL